MSTFRFSDWLRPHLRNLRPYSSARSEFSGRANVFLDANENPEDTGFNRYPDPLQKDLRRLLSGIKAVSPESMFIGNGSDEPIDLLMRAFCNPGTDNIVITDPTYGMYQVSASIHDVQVRKVPLRKDFSLDAAAVLRACDANTRLVFLCSPNNPTGDVFGRNAMLRVIRQFPGPVVVDEAYIDFCPEESLVKRLNSLPNLVILQTLSKAWGLAGSRLGLCFGTPELTGILNAIKPPYNISQPAQEAAYKRLRRGRAAMEKSVGRILSERARLEQVFSDMNLKVFPSATNFLLVRFPDAAGMFQSLKRKGIIVRDRSRELHCNGCLRITVGTRKENTVLIKAIRQILHGTLN